MKAIKSTVFAALLFTSTAVLAQADSTHPKKQERYFTKFSVQFGPTQLRFFGKKDAEAENSTKGFGGQLLPAWNITDNHSVGLKMIWSYHNDESFPDYFSLLANYQFNFFVKYDNRGVKEPIPLGLYSGIGVGFSNATSDSISKVPLKTSFAMMPYLGFRYGHLYIDGHFHWSAGNKQDTYIGCAIGILFGGGRINKS